MAKQINAGCSVPNSVIRPGYCCRDALELRAGQKKSCIFSVVNNRCKVPFSSFTIFGHELLTRRTAKDENTVEYPFAGFVRYDTYQVHRDSISNTIIILRICFQNSNNCMPWDPPSRERPVSLTIRQLLRLISYRWPKELYFSCFPQSNPVITIVVITHSATNGHQ